MATKKAKKTTKTSTRTTRASKLSDKALLSESQFASLRRLSNPFKNLNLRNLRFDKRISLPIIGLIIILVLGYLANKYLVVAWVDMKPITRFEYYNELSKRYGKDELDQLIIQKLVESEASKRGITVTEPEIQSQISQIEAQQGGAAQLDQILQMQNLTRSDLHDLVKLQVFRQKLFGAGINISDADINEYMTQNKASLPEIKPGDASGEAQLKDTIRQQLLQQKISATFSAWVQSNNNSSRVVKVQP